LAEKANDVLLIPLSDMHSGSTTALFPDTEWRFKHSKYPPTGKQAAIYEHFIKCAEWVKENRKKKRLIIVNNGDAIEGIHHYTLQLTSQIEQEQEDVHVHLMQKFMKACGFDKNKGDLLYYVSGTETHTNNSENFIARQLGAEQNPDGSDLWDFLPLEINGRLTWFLHQGAGPGKGANMGDALRIWLKNKYWEIIERNYWDGKERLPDLIFMGHYHVPLHTIYSHYNFDMHALILPSWQMKTRFGYRVAAAEPERVGMASVEISKTGGITVNKTMLMKMPDETIVV
jgi:hypothetical protein